MWTPSQIQQSPQPKWKQLAFRRLQIWGGNMTARKVLVPQEMPPFVDKYPDIIGRIRATGAFDSSPHGAPNHIIMNEYCTGQGIMPHEDGPAYHPVVATLSLGSHAVFHYYRYSPHDEVGGAMGKAIDPVPVMSLLLEPRSLVITTSSMYTALLHGIDGVEEDVFPAAAVDGSRPVPQIANADLLAGEFERTAVANGGVLKRGTRYSLTCRDVEKVASGTLFKKRV
ncbi:Alpha-ketoglutarate-dependent dioxygenase alkB 6 [Grifola frondosa]|uniref:Alpha-ketoglutarate-dependent dioxygenase alkB 6 n=1 Tax=Grifola frondosa TaxID=5627 RepID=A0A1C7MD85_GRIFR|nr:Alpha-ketoglutarate-dependent dioxygenase alkB 6 [Grifola frondosa]